MKLVTEKERFKTDRREEEGGERRERKGSKCLVLSTILQFRIVV